MTGASWITHHVKERAVHDSSARGLEREKKSLFAYHKLVHGGLELANQC